MLLYDRLLTHVTRYRGAGNDDGGFIDSLRKASVYEVTSVFPLICSYPSTEELGVPRRPPSDPVWVEWEDNSPSGDGSASADQLGAILLRLDTEWAKAFLLGGSVTDLRLKPTVSLDPSEFDEFYSSAGFRYNKTPHNVLTGFNGRVVWMGRNAMSTMAHLVIPHKPQLKHEFGLPLLPMAMDVDGFYGADVLPWVAFMSFALLHCRNVVTEEVVPDEQTQRRVRKSGGPPRVSYKTLKLEVPKTSAKRPDGGEPADEDARKVRFHLCRGHFKNLQHERYKEKGWHWWPAHWKGDPSLGEVVKDYRLDSERGST